MAVGCALRKIVIGLGLLLFSLIAGPHAQAQCTGGLINNCPSAVSPAANDVALTWQQVQSPHTRQMTLSQIMAGGLASALTVPIRAMPSTQGTAGLNLGVGATPLACNNGDLWSTGSGLFSCVNNLAVGPYGTGGSSLPVYTTTTLPTVTAANAGSFAFVTNCPNGSQVGLGATGCPYVVDTTGTWTALPYPPSTAITIGGQAIYVGGATNNQGNGTKLQLASGGFTAGNALAFDSNGNAVDAGTPPSGGTGGGGTVASGPVNSLPFYSSSPTGSTLAAMTITPNAVVGTSPSGVPSELTTLPSSLIIPAPTISGAILTGTTSQSTTNYTGKITTVASVAGGAGFNVPPGVAPSAPTNGDMWTTTSGLLARVNGATQGPYVASIVSSSPLSGGAVGPTVTLTCATCATTTNGGALSATAPITISAAGLIALGAQPGAAVWIADSATNVHNDTYNLFEKWPYVNSGTINSITYHTGGASTPSFTVSLQIAGTPVTGCNGLGVSSSSDTTTTCTAANTITNGQALGLVISGTSGTPSSAVVQVNYAKPAS